MFLISTVWGVVCEAELGRSGVLLGLPASPAFLSLLCVGASLSLLQAILAPPLLV